MKTILNRTVDPGAAAIVKRHRLNRTTTPVRTPAMPEVEMWSRWCVPLRRAGHFLGLMWVLDRDESLDEDDLQPAVDCAELAASVLAQTRQSAESIQFIQDELLAGRRAQGAARRPDATRRAVRAGARLQPPTWDGLGACG